MRPRQAKSRIQSMNLHDRIFLQPASFGLGCLTWVPLAIWILAMVRWMVAGDIDVVLGIVGIFVAVTLGYVSINLPSPHYSLYAFCCAAVTVVIFPFVSKGMKFRSLRSLDVESTGRAYADMGM